MPKRIVPLTDVAIRNAKPALKDYKMFDGGGLYILITVTGGKLWYLKYRFSNKEKKLSFGAYPAVTLSDARAKREEARRQIIQGIDPGTLKKVQKEAQTQETETFEVIAREWHARFLPQWDPGHAKVIMRRLERDLFPWLGKRPIAEIKAAVLLTVLRRIEDRGAIETAHRIKNLFGQVVRYAVSTGRAERDPSSDLKGALPPVKEKHLAAITDPKEVAALLRAIDSYSGTFPVKCALKLAPLLFCRPGELRQAEWAEIDLDAAEWNIPAEKMKMKEPHLVPLSTQAVAILRELHSLTRGGRYVFPSGRTLDRPLSNNAVNAALRRMGFDTKNEITGHGFRAMARTILDEVLGYRPDIIEHQLAHAVRDPLGRAYNRTSHLPERRKMMQAWADYLDQLKAGTKIIPIRAAAG